MAEEQVKEALQFVTHPRTDVRRMAVELLKTLTPAGSESRPILRNVKAAVALAKVATDADPVTAKDATAALVNLTDEHAIVLQLVEGGFIPTLVENICAKDNKLLSLHVMLLNNITTWEEGCRKVLRCGAKEPAELRGFEALKLVELFVQSGKAQSPAADDPLGWLGSVLQNLAQIPEGRTIFCDPSKGLLQRIAPFIRHSNPLRRRGSIGLIKNCLFNDLCHPQALSDEARVLANMMLALAPVGDATIFASEDRSGMPMEVLAELDDKNRKRETDATNKKLMLEALLLLTKTKTGRETLRKKNLYPIIREMHREDESQITDPMNDTIGKLVECLQLPEAEETKKPPKVEEIEEIV